MDVRDSGMTILWLRVLWRTNPHQRKSMNEYMNTWIRQVKLAERALERSNVDEPSKLIRVRS
jgi:hypothetical protein